MRRNASGATPHALQPEPAADGGIGRRWTQNQFWQQSGFDSPGTNQEWRFRLVASACGQDLNQFIRTMRDRQWLRFVARAKKEPQNQSQHRQQRPQRSNRNFFSLEAELWKMLLITQISPRVRVSEPDAASKEHPKWRKVELALPDLDADGSTSPPRRAAPLLPGRGAIQQPAKACSQQERIWACASKSGCD